MKKIAIALMCTILATGAAMAQEQFTFGPKIGVDYTHYWGKDVGHGGVLNYQIGLFMEYRINNKFSVAPEFVFAAQGGKYEDVYRIPEMGKIEVNVTDHANYINVPVMLKYYVIPELSIDFGPQIGFNIYSKYTAKAKDSSIEFKETYDEKEETKNVDFGFGLGVTYNLAKDVFVQGRYTMGVTKTFNYGNDKNGNAQIAIGYRF
ncbi:MAG: PorT family protein [Muribaculaceae bacterium]|nr:PorT family protein [Muribaculaceae bacterium]